MEELSEQPTEAPAEKVRVHVSHEEFFGKLLAVSSVLFFVVLFGILAWFGYRNLWEKKDTRSSIEMLPKEEVPVIAETVEKTAPPTEKPAVAIDKAVAITVLNGGSTKGAAGVGQTFLKGEGFTNVAAANAAGNYSGTTVYYGADTDKGAADTLKTVLEKKYKDVSVSKSTSASDTKKSAIVVIVSQ